MLSSSVVGIYISIDMANTDKCVHNPLVYGANYYSELYGVEFVGTGYFLIEKGQSPMVIFNRHNISMQTHYNNRPELAELPENISIIP